jgi:Flp pilus assembly protein TadB
MACTRVAAAAIVGGAQTTRFYVGSSSSSAASGGRRLGCSNGSRVSMAAQWLPGQPRPSYLDGSAPGSVVHSAAAVAALGGAGVLFFGVHLHMRTMCNLAKICAEILGLIHWVWVRCRKILNGTRNLSSSTAAGPCSLS